MRRFSGIALAAAVLVAGVASSSAGAGRDHRPAPAADSWRAVRPGEVIVRLTGPVTGARLAALGDRVGAFRLRRELSLIDGFAATVTDAQAAALARHPLVASIEPDRRVRALNDSAQQSFGVTKARLDAGVDGNADGSAAYSKADFVAAVLDTGIHAAHQDLDGGKVIAFRDFVNGRTAPYDDEGHGTHVAATLAGDKGVAPGGALVGVKVLDAGGGGSESAVIVGIEWVVTNRSLYGIEAINLSLGVAGCSNGLDALSAAVNAAAAAGLVVVAAAGNEGPGTCTVGSPGAAAGALTVGAMADLGEKGFYQGFFSSRGPTADGRVKPDVSAPGVRITSAKAGTTSGYATFDGTSMATPFVAGVALLMLDANPALTPGQVKQRIRATAADWGPPGADIDYGAGRLDAYAAVRAAGTPIDAPPAVPAHVFLSGSVPHKGSASYPLTVTSTEFPIAATLVISSLAAGTAGSPDLDLYLRDPRGAVVAKSEFNTRQEELGYQPTETGAYTLRVESFTGSASYFVDVSLATTLPSLTATDSSVAEGAGAASVTLSLSAPSPDPIAVSYSTRDGSARSPADYTGSSGTVTFAAGQRTKTVAVPIVSDALDELDEFFTVALSSPANATLADGTAVVTIADDDPRPALSIRNARVQEGDSGTRKARFVVRLSAPSGLPVSVRFKTVDGTAHAPGDYRAKTGTLTFLPGVTSVVVKVRVRGDTRREGDESFFVKLRDSANATFADARARGTIVNDD